MYVQLGGHRVLEGDQDHQRSLNASCFRSHPVASGCLRGCFQLFEKKRGRVSVSLWVKEKQRGRIKAAGGGWERDDWVFVIQTSVSWIKDKKFGVWAGELRCCSSFSREVTRVRQVKCTRDCDDPAGFHSSVSSQPAECCHRGRHTRQVTAPHVTTPE